MLDSPDLHAPEFDDAELDVMLDLAKKRSQGLRTRRARNRSITGVITLALVVALVGASVLRLDGHTRSPQVSPPAAHATHSGVAPSWKLVGDVSPAWQEVSPSGYDAGFDLTCPTATTCYAEDASPLQVEVSHDGGATWQQSTLPADIAQGSGLACTDADTCALLGQDSSGNDYFLMTGDGGQTWSSLPGPSQLSSSSVSMLSCSTATSCLAVVSSDGDGSASSAASVTTDGGQSWTASQLPQNFEALSGQCFAGGGCVLAGFDPGTSAAGVALYSTDGGSTWSSASVPNDVGALTSLSCSEASDCYVTAFGANPGGDTGGLAPSGVLVTTDGGQSWSATNTGELPSSLVTSISCPSSSYCWASGVIVPSGTGSAITFADAQGLLATSADGGQSWETTPLPQGVRAVAQVSCPDMTTCFALGYDKPTSGDASFVLLSYGG